MGLVKQKILDKIETLGEPELQELLKYADFLVWRKTESEKVVEQSLESDDNCLVEYVGDVLVVKAQGATNIENTLAEIREQRIQELSGW